MGFRRKKKPIKYLQHFKTVVFFNCFFFLWDMLRFKVPPFFPLSEGKNQWNSPTCRQTWNSLKRQDKKYWASCFTFYFACFFLTDRSRCTLDYPSRTSTPLARQIPPALCVRDSPACLSQSHCSPLDCPFDLLTLFTPDLHQRPNLKASHAFITLVDLDLWTICRSVSQGGPCFQNLAQ